MRREDFELRRLDPLRFGARLPGVGPLGQLTALAPVTHSERLRPLAQTPGVLDLPAGARRVVEALARQPRACRAGVNSSGLGPGLPGLARSMQQIAHAGVGS